MERTTQSSTFGAWLNAFRLRTLPLAFSCIMSGTAVALHYVDLKPEILILALLTTLLLQILSNLANDYGDTVNGADNDGRIGPMRTVQSGLISLSAMKRAIIIIASLAFISGITLLWVSFGREQFLSFVVFLALGLLAIAAAVKYTVGSSPYGYKGLGDLFVFLFFGMIGVGGTYFLHTMKLHSLIVFPAIAVGSWATAVLNLNNLRDHQNDEMAGKRTMVVKMGFSKGKKYHLVLLLIGWVAAIAYIIGNSSPYMWITIIPAAIHIAHYRKLISISNPAEIDPELRKVALSTFLYSLLLFTVSIYVS